MPVTSTRTVERDAVPVAPDGGSERRSHALLILALAGISFSFVALMTSRVLFLDGFMNLYSGRFVADHGIPEVDTLTIAGMGRDWIDQQWLANYLFYKAWLIGGYRLVAGLSAVLVASAFGMLAGLMLERGVGGFRTATWTLLAFIACMINTVVRAQSFAYPLAVAVLWCLLREATPHGGRRALWSRWLVLPLLALWANLHGSAVLFAALTTVVLLIQAGRAAKVRDAGLAMQRVAVALLAPVMLCVTPYGLQMLGYYRSILGNPLIRDNVAEWQATDFSNPVGYGFLALLFMVVFIGGVAVGRSYRPSLVLVVASLALGLAGTQTLRSQIWFAFPAALLAAECMARFTQAETQIPPPRIFVALLGTLVTIATLGAGAFLFATPNSQFLSAAPVGLVRYLGDYAEAHPSAKILADETTAATGLWLEPGLEGRVALDPRFEVYEQDELQGLFDFISVKGSNWLGGTRDYDVLAASRDAHAELVSELRAASKKSEVGDVLHDSASGIAVEQSN